MAKKKQPTVQTNETYIQLLENNDWEGESWNFFVKASAPETQILVEMVKVLNKSEDDSFEIVSENVPESEVQVLVKQKNSSATYFNDFNLVKKIKYTTEELQKALSEGADAIQELLYKGKCFKT